MLKQHVFKSVQQYTYYNDGGINYAPKPLSLNISTGYVNLTMKYFKHQKLD